MPELARTSAIGRPSARSPRRSCRPPARRAAAARARRTARGRARRACGCRTRAPATGRSRCCSRSEQRGDLAHAPACSARSRRAAGSPRPVRHEARLREPVAPEQQVVLRRWRSGESAMFWKVRLMPERGDAVRAQAREVPVAVAHAAGGRRVDAGEHVQRRRLAGAVRADEGVDRARLDGEGDVVDRGDPAEAHRQALRDERLGAARGAARGSSHRARPRSRRGVADPPR